MHLKNLLAAILLSFTYYSCQQKPVDKDIFLPSKRLTMAEDSAFKYSIIRYVGKLPPKASHNIKFDSYFDEYYIKLANIHKLDFYYPSKDGFVYFQMSRTAPSLYEKYVATGGKLKRDSQGKIVYYEETYRTWKMPREELLDVTKGVFSDMVNGKGLEKYYTKNTPSEVFIIEFPDDETYFDTNKRIWLSKRTDVLQQFEEQKLQVYEEKFLQNR